MLLAAGIAAAPAAAQAVSPAAVPATSVTASALAAPESPAATSAASELPLAAPASEVAPLSAAAPEPAALSSEPSKTGETTLSGLSIDAPSPAAKPRKHSPEQEIAVEGLVSYGNWQIFAAGIDESLYTAGFEYDRHSWGQFIGAQMDYAADFMPLVLLKEPAKLNPYGVRRSPKGDIVLLHGLAFSPIGLRMQWRHNKAFKPYMTVLGGAIGFTQKALSPDASYYDFTLHETVGFYYRMTERIDMRFGLFGDFHFSNAYITSYNPGLDVMNSNLAVSYHFGGDPSAR